MKYYSITYRWYSKSLRDYLECETLIESDMVYAFIESVPWEIISMYAVEVNVK